MREISVWATLLSNQYEIFNGVLEWLLGQLRFCMSDRSDADREGKGIDEESPDKHGYWD